MISCDVFFRMHVFCRKSKMAKCLCITIANLLKSLLHVLNLTQFESHTEYKFLVVYITASAEAVCFNLLIF